MAPLRFRAWDVFYSKFIYSDDTKLSDFWLKVEGGRSARREVPVNQSTGLHDKNVTELFDADILRDDASGVFSTSQRP